MYTFLAEVMAGNWNFLLHLVSLDLWPITFTKKVIINFNVSYQISRPLDIASWNYGWKFTHLAPNQWPLTLQFDIRPILFIRNVWLFISILPTIFHDNWTFQAKVIAQRSYFWPKFNDLWPLNFSKFYQNLISAFTCHVLPLGQF